MGPPLNLQPLQLSLEVAVVALLVVACTAIPAARFMSSRAFSGSALVEAVLLLPLVLPPVVTGFGLLLLLGRHGWAGEAAHTWLHRDLLFSPFAAVVASATAAFPLMYLTVKAAFLGVDAQLEDVACSLGASAWRTFVSVTIPLAWTGLAAGCLLCFARALGEFGATIMVAGDIPGRTTTVPTAIYMLAEGGDLRLAGLYAALAAGANLVLVLAVNALARRHSLAQGRGRRH